MIALDIEMPKYCWYYDIDGNKKWKECPVYKSCKYHTSDIDVKPSNCPLVDIVTCKDCVKGHKYKNVDECYCDYLKDDVDVDFFCAEAERRE